MSPGRFIDRVRRWCTLLIMLTRRGVAKRLKCSIATVRRLEGRELFPSKDARGVHRFEQLQVERSPETPVAASVRRPGPRLRDGKGSPRKGPGQRVSREVLRKGRHRRRARPLRGMVSLAQCVSAHCRTRRKSREGCSRHPPTRDKSPYPVAHGSKSSPTGLMGEDYLTIERSQARIHHKSERSPHEKSLAWLWPHRRGGTRYETQRACSAFRRNRFESSSRDASNVLLTAASKRSWTACALASLRTAGAFLLVNVGHAAFRPERDAARRNAITMLGSMGQAGDGNGWGVSQP